MGVASGYATTRCLDLEPGAAPVKARSLPTPELVKVGRLSMNRLKDWKDRIVGFAKNCLAVYHGWLSRNDWLPILSALLLIGLFLFWLRYLTDLRDENSTQWALSSIVQAWAALAGLLVIGITLLWSQALAAKTHLRSLKSKYVSMLRRPDGKGLILRGALDQVRHQLQFQWSGIASSYSYHPYALREVAYQLGLLSVSLFEADPREIQDGFGLEEWELLQLEAGAASASADAVAFMQALDSFCHAYSDPNMGSLPEAPDLNDLHELATKLTPALQIDDVKPSLDRLRSFEHIVGFRGKIATLLFLSTIVVGMVVLLSTERNPPLWAVSLVLALALASLEALILLMEQVVRRG